MVKVLTYDIPDYKMKLKIRQLQVMGKKIQGKLITQAMNITNPDMLLKFERGIRGGTTQAVHHYASVNNPCMGDRYNPR